MTFERVEGTDFELPCELVLLAMGFVGPQRPGLLEQLGVELNERGNVTRDDAFRTNLENVFVCGDMGRGQSLIVWAIAEGRSCAAAVDEFLMGETLLPAPIAPDDGPAALTRLVAGGHPSRAVRPGGSAADGPSSASQSCEPRVSATRRL